MIVGIDLYKCPVEEKGRLVCGDLKVNSYDEVYLDGTVNREEYTMDLVTLLEEYKDENL